MNAETFSPIPFLDLKAQQSRLGPALRRRIDSVLAHGQYILGPEVAELETALQNFTGARHCVTVSSGTDALQIALMAENIGPGDAVFLPAFTYTATAEVILVLRATPIFVDVDPNTFQIDTNHLKSRIAEVKSAGRLTPRAIIGVDLFGQPADWPEITAIAEANNIFTLDDAAQSFGATLHNRRLGTFAHATATSFFPSKPFGAYGDGGALFTESNDRAALYRSLRTHGEGTTRYEVLRIGMNGRLDTIQAAILLAKLEIFEDELTRRDQIAQLYNEGLKNLVETPTRIPNTSSAWAVYPILFDSQSARDAAQTALKAAGIGHAIYYPRPLHHQPAYTTHHDATPLPISESIATRILALPIHPDLTDAQASRVIATLRGAP